MFVFILKNRQAIKATAITEGYILLILLLYQFKKFIIPLLNGFINKVKPEQKKNSTSPIVPPVAKKSYLAYNKSTLRKILLYPFWIISKYIEYRIFDFIFYNPCCFSIIFNRTSILKIFLF